MWDSTAVAVGIHALGAVEASMDYGAINPTDPISIGIFQWYAGRAAAVLSRIKTENPSSYANLPSSLRADLDAHPASDSYWNSRYVSSAEHDGLSAVLAANKTIQDSQAATDFDSYRVTAVNEGMNANTNTKSVLFFANMYNQGPKYALDVLKAATINGTLDDFHREVLANAVLGDYPSRYDTAYDIINRYDTGGVTIGGNTDTGGSTPPVVVTPPDDPTPQTPTDLPVSRVSYIKGNDSIVIRMPNGGTVTCYAIGSGEYLPRSGTATTDPDPTPTPPAPTDPPDPDPTPPPPPPPPPAPDTPPSGLSYVAPRNDYPYPTRSWHDPDPWAFYYRECTSFAAWRVRTRTGRTTFNNHYRTMWGKF